MYNKVFGIDDQLIKKADNVLKIAPFKMYYQPNGTDLLPVLEDLGVDISINAYLQFLLEQWQKFGLNVIINKYEQIDTNLQIYGVIRTGYKNNQNGILNVKL